MPSDEKASAAATPMIARVQRIPIFRGPPSRKPTGPVSYLRSQTILSICGIAFTIFFVLDGSNGKRVTTDDEAGDAGRVPGGSFVEHSGALRQLAPEREDDDQG